jgi:hypothetical protein
MNLLPPSFQPNHPNTSYYQHLSYLVSYPIHYQYYKSTTTHYQSVAQATLHYPDCMFTNY